MPCRHNLEAYLHAYIDGCELGDDRKGPLFRTTQLYDRRHDHVTLDEVERVMI